MTQPALPPDPSAETDDARTLAAMGYTQELARRMSAFSNFAISLSIICILAGGVTSFQLGLCSVGGASIGLGWPLSCAFSLLVAATMAQVASAFPTAGGLYHWAAILGGRGWGWATAWFNLAGLVTVLAAINVGSYRFLVDALGWSALGGPTEQLMGVALISASQALINHFGIRITTRLTDFSGWWILAVASALTVALLAVAPNWDFGRLIHFENFSGPPGGNVWPATDNLWRLFALGLLLPAYTITGFDASAHTAEETLGASTSVPRGIVRSVLVSGVAGWVFLIALVVAAPSLETAAAAGEGAFRHILQSVFSRQIASFAVIAVFVAQYLCGLATVTSASRMAFAFARDGGMPASRWVRWVSPRFQTPAVAIWLVTVSAVLFTVWSPIYATITAVCTILLYLSYVVPTWLGFLAIGRTWNHLGPWHLGRWYKPLALVSVLGCLVLVVIGMQPPNQKAAVAVGGFSAVLALIWFSAARRRFPGPPVTSS